MNSPQSPVQASQPILLADVKDGDEIDLLSLFDVLLDARWLIAGVTVLVLLLGGAYAFLSRPVYEVNSLIQVEDTMPGATRILGEAASLFDISGTESIHLGQLDVPAALEGKPLLLVVTEKGFELRDPDGQPLVTGKPGTVAEFGSGDTHGRILVAELKAKPGAHFNVVRRSRLSVVERLQQDLAISERGRQSGVIAVRLQGTDPQQIARTLNAVGTNYVRQNIERKSAEAEKSLIFLDTFLPQLKKQLEDSESRYNKFRNQSGTFDLDAQGKGYLEVAIKLQTSLLELQQKRREQSAQFTAEHPVIQTLDTQIAAVTKEIDGLTSKVKNLPNIEQNLLRLTRDVKVNGELYTSLLNSAQQLRLVKEGKVGNVCVVDAPVVPENPIKPQRSQILAISAVLGLLLGMGLAFVRNGLRHGIKDVEDIESATGLRVFATVPHAPEQEKFAKLAKDRALGTHLLAIALPDAPSIESLRSLRTALQFAMLDARNNVVLFTGPTPGIGKSFASANFAAVLGAGGKRVLLIDADLRKGHIHQTFGLQRGHGLSELITGTCALNDVVHRAVAPNVDLITTGTLPPNPSELLLSPATAQLLQSVAAQYDMVLIDTPPVLAVADTQVLALHAGTVFLVVRAEVTSLGELQESAKRLSQAGVPVKGVVFNDLDTSRKRYGGYGYKYSRYRYTNYQYGNTNGQ